MSTTTFNIGGMHCAACVARNESTLATLPGVRRAVINLANASALVEFDDKAISESAIHAAVLRNGYQVLTGAGLEQHKANAEAVLLAARNRAVVALLLSTPVVVLAMFEISLPWSFAGLDASLWVQAVLGSIVILGLGYPFHAGMLRQAMHLAAGMDTLISIGTLSAFGLSLFAMAQGMSHVYFETGAVIAALILLGRYFEARSRGQASAAIEKLMELGAKQARVIRDGVEREIAVEQVRVGDTLQVRPGEKVPVDGLVIDGSCSVDESMLTGESMPVTKHGNETVFGGTINTTGAFRMRATKVGEDTALAQIVRLVAAAQTNKAPMQRLADRISGVFVPVVLTLAALTAIGWYLVSGDLQQSLVPAIAVLVIACPCSLGLATPTAIMVGTGLGARRGILIKDGEALERASLIDVVLFDKTGTLTEGKPVVTAVVPAGDTDANELLRIAAGAELLSEHPLAQAIVREATARGIAAERPESFLSVSGQGARARLGKSEIVIGSPRFLQTAKVQLDGYASRIEDMQSAAQTVVAVARDGKLLGAIGIADTIKADAAEALSKLRARGTETVMITGDNRRAAEAIASRLPLSAVKAEVLPAAKADEVRQFQQAGKKVAFVGDGINDAPALAQADLGIAMGTGTDIAMEAGHIVLVKGSPLKVVEALDLAALTLRTIRQNLFWAFAYNVAALPLAALGMLNPMIAAAAMGLSSITVVANSLRIRSRSERA